MNPTPLDHGMTRPAATKRGVAARTRSWTSLIVGLVSASQMALGPSAISAAEPGARAGFSEPFTDDPSLRGWRVVGDPSLFNWDADRGALQVTWDSRRTNSFFYRPLGTVLSATDDFRLAFDLELSSITPGVDPAKPSTFQIAAGFLDLAAARRTNFFRASGVHSDNGARSVLEWNYFPDTGFGATVSPAVFASNNIAAVAFTFPLELRTGVRHRVVLEYSSAERRLRTTMLADGEPMGPINDVQLPADPTFDFRVDTVAVTSYSDAGQSGAFAGSILAEGWGDNLEIALPPPLFLNPIERPDGLPRIRFHARARWRYVLERSIDLRQWTEVDGVVADSAGARILTDGHPPASQALYRVRSELP